MNKQSDEFRLDIRDVTVEKFAHRKRSNLTRSADRSIRGSRLNGSPHNPRPDNVVMLAWLDRAVRRTPDVFAVDEPQWQYNPDDYGPGATQVAYVRAVLARDDYEREFFGRGIKLAPGLRDFRYAVPARVSAVDNPPAND